MSHLVKKLITPLLITSSLFLSKPLFNQKSEEIRNLNAGNSLIEERNQIRYAQEILKKEGYLLEFLDGIYGPRTEKALIAFQKIHGLKITGKIDEEVVLALKNPKRPEPKYKKSGLYIEVDLSNQLLYLIEDAKVQHIIPASTGRRDFWTPKGIFQIYGLEKRGWRNGFNRQGEVMGRLYNPIKFYKTYYIHGSDYVPLYPASSGCVRVEPYHVNFLHEKVRIGTEVIIY